MVEIQIVHSELRPARAIAAIYEPTPNPFRARIELAKAIAADFEIHVEPHEIAVERIFNANAGLRYSELVRLMGVSRIPPRSRKLIAYLASLSRLDPSAGPCGHA